MNPILKRTRNQKSPTHYFDGMIDMRIIPATTDGFSEPIAVFTNINANVMTVSANDPMYRAYDLISTYKLLWRHDWNMDDEFDDYLESFKKYLLRTGCKPEELED